MLVWGQPFVGGYPIKQRDACMLQEACNIAELTSYRELVAVNLVKLLPGIV